MRHPLDGVDAKVRRAKGRYSELHSLIADVLNTEGNGVVADVEPDARVYVLKIRVPYSHRVEWGVLLGEVAYDLHSALDQLIWQLVLRSGGTPDERNSFPIFDDEAKYPVGSRKRLNGITDPAVLTFIEDLQPYKGDHNYPLWGLSELSRWDKHRVINVTATGARVLALGISPTASIASFSGILPLVTIPPDEDQADITRLVFGPNQQKVDVHHETAGYMMFEKTGGFPFGGDLEPVMNSLFDLIENRIVIPVGQFFS